VVWYVDHAKALQQHVVAITVRTALTPRVAEDKRFSLVEIAPDFWRAVAHYGFMERPDVPRLLQGLKAGGCTIDLSGVTYYVGLESIVARDDGNGLQRWLVAIFAAMQRNAAHDTDVFNFPRDRVMEIGRQVAI
jgi:KUP system potassium uptake protein